MQNKRGLVASTRRTRDAESLYRERCTLTSGPANLPPVQGLQTPARARSTVARPPRPTRQLRALDSNRSVELGVTPVRASENLRRRTATRWLTTQQRLNRDEAELQHWRHSQADAEAGYRIMATNPGSPAGRGFRFYINNVLEGFRV